MPTTGRKAPSKTHVQTVIFSKAKWTPEKAREWLKNNGYSSGNMDETSTSYRFRQYDPEPSKFRYRTKTLQEGLSITNGFVVKVDKDKPLSFKTHEAYW